MPFAASFPAPIARITVAAPVTASPPANTPALEVAPVSSAATIHFLLLISRPLVVEEISGFGEDVYKRQALICQIFSKTVHINLQRVNACMAWFQIRLHLHTELYVILFRQCCLFIGIEPGGSLITVEVNAAVAGGHRRAASDLHHGIPKPVLISSIRMFNRKIVQFLLHTM